MSLLEINTMKKISKKFILRIGIIILLLAGGFLASLFQNDIIKIKADAWPILVSTKELEFGLVFPGEQADRNFIVTHEDGRESVHYKIIEKYKPLPGAEVPDGYSGSISDYCQDYPDNFDKCYRNLCPYIIEYSNEEEGDVVTNALIGVGDDDSDTWIVHLNTPAIAGNISQDHTGGIISANGEYGCDLSVDIEVEEPKPYCGDGNLDPGEECDDGNKISGDGCSASCEKENGGGGGGGGGTLVSLQINNAKDCVPTEDGAYFSWMTNMKSSSRVVCDTEPHPDWGTPPDYGYTFFTEEYDKNIKVMNHKVEIPGLIPGESYYCRVVSSDSSATVFKEMICSIPGDKPEEKEEKKGEVKGANDVVIPKALPRTGFGKRYKDTRYNNQTNSNNQ